MTSILKHHGLSRDVKNAHYAHMECEEYRQSRKELEKLNKHINELKQKPDAEITQEEVKMIKNQNDFMRSEIVKRDEKIRILSKKAGARFVPFEVYSPDKMQFITDELQRSNIQFVEESNTLYIPDWATKNCCAIAAKYQFPSKSTGIHDEIKLDIDTLVYSCENFPQLLDKLREKGYEVKEGKYLAVKSPNAQRFVRLKTLGEEYLPQNIEKRIADRDKFPKQVQARSAKANETEQRFYSTITQTVIAVRTFMFRPQKTKDNNPDIINPSITRTREEPEESCVPAADMIDGMDFEQLKKERACYAQIVRDNTDYDRRKNTVYPKSARHYAKSARNISRTA